MTEPGPARPGAPKVGRDRWRLVRPLAHRDVRRCCCRSSPASGSARTRAGALAKVVPIPVIFVVAGIVPFVLCWFVLLVARMPQDEIAHPLGD